MYMKQISHYSWFCENSCAYLSREWEVQEEVHKIGGTFNVWKHGKCKSKGVCFVRDKKKYMASEHMEIMRVSRQYVLV